MSESGIENNFFERNKVIIIIVIVFTVAGIITAIVFSSQNNSSPALNAIISKNMPIIGSRTQQSMMMPTTTTMLPITTMRPTPLAPEELLPAQPPGQRVAVPTDKNGRVWGYGPRSGRTGCPVDITGFSCRADGVWLEPAFDGEWVWYFDVATNRYFHRNEITATRERAPKPTTTTMMPTTTMIPFVYKFISHTFTTAGKSGKDGPILAEVRNAYSGVSWAQNSEYLNIITHGIQEWKVPVSGSYTIRAVGAGVPYNSNYKINGLNNYQKGIDATITTKLIKGEVIKILVGQIPGPENPNIRTQRGGAGGTFVVRGVQTPIIIAGGGGSRGVSSAIIVSNATTSNTGQSGGGSQYFGVGGTDGNGGKIGNNPYSGGGGGLISNGMNGTYGNGGFSFINGGKGGYYTMENNGSEGGFGGGGGGGGSAAGAGGGGYSGGGNGGNDSDNSISWTSGGGGGSYSITGNFDSAVANNNDNGLVVITLNTPTL